MLIIISILYLLTIITSDLPGQMSSFGGCFHMVYSQRRREKYRRVGERQGERQGARQGQLG